MAEPGERVAVFLPSLEGGGGERTAALLAGALARRGWDVDLVLGRATGPFLVSVDPRVRVVDLGAKRFVLSLPRLMRYLRRERPRAMVSHVAVADFVHLVARRLTGIPRQSVVSVANDLYFGDVRIRLPQVRLAVRLLPHMYRWATRLVAVSHGVAASVVRASRLPESAVTVIYNPIIDDGLLAARHAPLDHPWFVQGAPPVLLGVGRLAGQKDFGTLLRAFALVRADREARLLILGEGPERGSLEGLVSELGLEDDVSLPGFVDNPFQYMSRAAAFCLSSRHEGLPTVMVEALACGCPVVSTDCPSGPREILDGGRYGHLVPVGDHEALAEAMLRCLDGDRRPVDPEWLEQFTLDRAATAYEEVLGLRGERAQRE